MIDISNHTSEDNPSWSAVLVVLTQPLITAKVTDHSGSRPLGARIRNTRDWLASLPRRWGDRWLALNDAEAQWRGSRMTRVHVGLGRRYRDPPFDRPDVPSVPCLGTGRVTIRR